MTLPEPPTPADMATIERLVAPAERLLEPLYAGTEHLPHAGPVLFVGNHTLAGAYDVGFLYLHVWRERGMALRALGDHMHFKVPGWRELVTRLGVVHGTRENCAALMQRGEALLVFPGGSREVTKGHDEEYALLWKQRTGVARMAIANRCPIVPFGSVGVEDGLDVIVDVRTTPLGALLRKAGWRDDLTMPIVAGAGPLPVPRPERLYIGFGEPIDPTAFGSDPSDDDAAWALREHTREAVEDRIAAMRALQASDPKRQLAGRVVERMKSQLRELMAQPDEG
jgi:1-acyl-sn-glycerol-3-phosphate acyltransferase